MDLKDHCGDHILLLTKNLNYRLELEHQNYKLHVLNWLMYMYYKDDSMALILVRSLHLLETVVSENKSVQQ